MSVFSDIRHVLQQLEFRQPWLLWVAAGAVVVFVLSLLQGGRLRFSSTALLPAGRSTWRVRLSWLPAFSVAVAAALFAVVLAEPRVPDSSQRIPKEGIAIAMVLDTSGSMRALDLSTDQEERTRLDAAVEVFRSFVAGDGKDLRGRQDDAIGIVTFAGFADTRCPLTLDHRILFQILDSVEIVTSRSEDGTALGDGLLLAVERLRRSEAESRVIILLTDGVNNAGQVAPLTAAQIAADKGIAVYTIGAGTSGFAPVRVQDAFGRSVLTREPVTIDEKTLKEIADTTGGRYFRATNAAGLEKVYAEIDALERTVISEERFRNFNDYSAHFLVAALIFAMLGFLGQATTFRRLP